MKKTVCVTGGSGGIGHTLLRYLIRSFYVKALFRKADATTAHWQEQGCEIIFGDLSDQQSLADLVAGTELVFHCAALTTSFSQQEAHEVNVEGTRRLALAAANLGCKRFIHVSSIGVYMGAHRQRQVYTEELELNGFQELELYCLTKLRSETALKEVAKYHRLEYVILRPTFVYGPRVLSYTMTPFYSIEKGRPVILGAGNGLIDVVYVADVVTAILLAADAPEANGETFNVGGEIVRCIEFYAFYGRMLNRPVRHTTKIVASLLICLARIYPELSRRLAWYRKLQNDSCEYPSSKIKQLLGYSPKVPLKLGMLKTELWLAANGYIPSRNKILKNADDLYSFSPCTVVHPSEETEIVQAIQEAKQHGLKVRAIGSIHSAAPIPTTNGVCIELDNYKQVIRIDGLLVTVQAGIKIWELNEILSQHQLALPILGAIAWQTVSGAISTGTHGGSMHHQSLSSYVQSLRLVKADGSILILDRLHQNFNAVGLSMGLLGIISTVTFKCISAFSLQSKLSIMPIDTLLNSFDEIQRTNKFVDIRYTPITDGVQAILINPASEPLAEDTGWRSAFKNKLMQRLTRLAQEFVMTTFYYFQLNWLQRMMLEQQDKKSAYAVVSGRSDFVLTHYDASTTSNDYNEKIPPPRVSDVEFAIPYSQATAALACLRDHFRKTSKYPCTHIHIRCTAEEEFWLSPAYNQAVCWIEVWEYPRTGEFLEEIVQVLKPFNFRCHWGKDIPVEREYLQKQYTKWDDFLRLRQAWDPQGMFANPSLDKYLHS